MIYLIVMNLSLFIFIKATIYFFCHFLHFQARKVLLLEYTYWDQYLHNNIFTEQYLHNTTNFVDALG